MDMNEIVKLQEGITHVEDLPTPAFLSAIKHLDECEMSEKLDGANIRVHLDDGEITVSRESKNDAKRLSLDSNIPYSPKYTFQECALKFFSRIRHDLEESGMRSGDYLEVEVLMSEQPNAVVYDGLDRMAVIGASGNIDLNKLSERMAGKTHMVSHRQFEPSYEKMINECFTHYRDFECVVNPVMEGVVLTESANWQEIMENTTALETYLGKKSGVGNFTNGQVENMHLTKRPEGVMPDDWSRMKQTLRTIRPMVRENIQGMKGQIKSALIKEYVTGKKSQFGGDGSWIEGVVCCNPRTGMEFKIVDRETFTKVNKFVYEVRNSLTFTPHNEHDPKSFMGTTDITVCSAFGLPQLGTRKAKKFVLDETGMNVGNMTHVQAHNAALELIDGQKLDFNTIKYFVENYINGRINALMEEFADYMDNYKSKVLEVNGVKHVYTDEVHRRTMLTFIEVHDELVAMQEHMAYSGTLPDMLTYYLF